MSVFGVDGRDQDHGRPTFLRPEQSCHLQTVDARHPDVQEHDVRVPFCYGADRVGTVVDLGHDVDAIRDERPAGHRAEPWVVVDEHDAQWHPSIVAAPSRQYIRAGPEAEGTNRLDHAKLVGGANAVRVILVDDASLVREGIARLLLDAGVDVVAQLADASGLVDAVRAGRPDAVIIDVRMPPTHTTEGLEAALELKRELPELGVLVLSQHVETRHAVDLLRGGHRGVGYLLKERITRPEELVDALRQVAAGGTVIDPDVVRIVLDTPRRADPMARLTAKEREVLALVAEGSSNDRIAEQLDVTARTVETHTGRIFAKLGLEADAASHRRVLAVLAHLRASTSPS